MRVATGLLLAMWILFMTYMLMTNPPISFEGEVKRTFSILMLFVQAIAWAFVFTKPYVTFVILLLLTIISSIIGVVEDSNYFVFAVINLIFVLLSYAGHRELIKKEKSHIKAKG